MTLRREGQGYFPHSSVDEPVLELLKNNRHNEVCVKKNAEKISMDFEKVFRNLSHCDALKRALFLMPYNFIIVLN